MVPGMLLVYGEGSATYDFGPAHPLTPRRFGPGLDLLRAVGAVPGLAPEPAPDAELAWCHDARYLETVRAFGRDPFGPPAAGIGEGGDVPPFRGMHDAGAMVAGGTLRAVEAVLRGEVEHAFHPGGGLHHAMRDRASGFCIYNDPALAIARARREGLRVLYVDLDVHHGDGVQVLHADDAGVVTISFHETGRYLFPGTGFADEIGEGSAAGTVVNVPLEPGTGEGPWLESVRRLVPALAAAFGPDLVVSQHGADSHAWDPLAHLRVTTTAMGEAARIVDGVAHRFAAGRWLATGGGGYDAYRVVPRAWSLTWLAGAHRDVPSATPGAWRDRWTAEATRYGQAPLPLAFEDPPNAGDPRDAAQELADDRSLQTLESVETAVVPAILRAAAKGGWWRADEAGTDSQAAAPAVPAGTPQIVPGLDAAAWDRLRLAARVVAPADPTAAHLLIASALLDRRAEVTVTAAVVGDVVVGLCMSAVAHGAAEDAPGAPRDLLALGVAPGARAHGLGTALLRAHVETGGAARPLRALVTVAERDAIEPLDHATRTGIARRLLVGAGFAVRSAPGPIRQIDPLAIEAVQG